MLFCSCTVMYSRAFVSSYTSLVSGDGTRPTAARLQITVGTYSTCTSARQSEEEKVDRRDSERRSCSWSINIPSTHTHTHTDRTMLIRSLQKVLGDFKGSHILMIFFVVGLRCGYDFWECQLRMKLQRDGGGRAWLLLWLSLVSCDLSDCCSNGTAIKHGKQSADLRRSKQKAKIISSRHHIVPG